jgi:cell division protein FtsW
MSFFLIGSRRVDPILLTIIYSLAIFGIGVMFSASVYSAERDFSDPYFFVKRQFLFLCIGLFLFFIISQIDFTLWENLGLYLCIVSIFLLILVFVPGLGKSVGTYYGRSFNRWIGIGQFQIQPSEFSKITILIYLSGFFYNFDSNTPVQWKKFIAPALVVGSMLLLIVLEPSFGSTMEILFLIITLVFLAGISIYRILLAGLSVLPLLYLLVDRVGYRKKRIDIWLDPYSYRYEEGHQLVSSYQAFRSGSWWGNDIATGYAHRYLPYSHTDFVASPFVEDFGFIGFLVFWSAIVLLIIRGFLLLERVKNGFGFFLGSGILVLLSIQFLMNLFVVTGLLPITGVSLPFFSYGGSSLLTIFILCGILVNITQKENLEE